MASLMRKGGKWSVEMNRKYAESTSCVSSITACRGAVVPRFARVSAGVFTEF